MLQNREVRDSKYKELGKYAVFFASAGIFLLLTTASVKAETTVSGAKDKSAESQEMLEYTCNEYTEYSLEQVQDNNRYGCGFGGSHWSDNADDHKKWCLTNELSVTEQQRSKDKKLTACRKIKTSPHSQSNQIKVPGACKDPAKAYTPVKQVNWIDYLSERPFSPVEGSLIKYDFNEDKQLDYVFLEAREHRDVDAQFVICMSQKSTYRRHLTDIEFYTMPGLSFQGAKIENNDGVLKLRMLHYERAYGKAWRNVTYKFSTDTAKFTVVDTVKETYNVTSREGAYQMTPPKVPKLF